MNKALLAVCICIFYFIGVTTDFAIATPLHPTKRPPRFRVLSLSEDAGHHAAYDSAARIWLNKLAAEKNFTVDYIKNTATINDSLLSRYQLIIQLDYPPYGWTDTAVKAFEKYITEGKGGWIGFHHASLLGEFDGFRIWQWFSGFLGGIWWKNYIASFATATVKTEDVQHPVMKGLPATFTIEKEEWYTYDKSPRANVHVIASVDESSYVPGSDIKMGDHPVIWTNPHYKARNIYIFMGHSPMLFQDKVYTAIFKNAIDWAAAK